MSELTLLDIEIILSPQTNSLWKLVSDQCPLILEWQSIGDACTRDHLFLLFLLDNCFEIYVMQAFVR